MATEEHISILRQGRDAWFEWRIKNPEILPDLRKVDLSGVNLAGAGTIVANFDRTDLSGANLAEADLDGAIFYGANLAGADLHGANLAGTILSRANLDKSDLGGAILCGADLSGARLIKANLARVDFRRVIFFETVFGDTDLSETEGLDQSEHRGPSIIDMRTLRQSWPLPLSFLRGCGLDDTFIEYLPSLVGEAIEFYSCFISYSSKNQDFAERLHADLQNEGVRCWFAPEDLKIGAKTRSAIDKAIRLRDKLLVIFSEEAIGSDWVETEVETAFAEERERGETVLFPVRIDDAVMETKAAWARHIKDTRHIGDFRDWKDHDSYQKAFKRLLRDLRASGNQ